VLLAIPLMAAHEARKEREEAETPATADAGVPAPA